MQASAVDTLALVGVGTWCLQGGELSFDEVAQRVLKVDAEMSWDDFLQRVHPSDQAVMATELAGGEARERDWVRFAFKTDDTWAQVEAVGVRTLEGRIGTLARVDDRFVHPLTGSPLSTWFAAFADGLSTALRVADVTKVISSLGEEVLGASFLGVSLPRDDVMAYLMAKPLPVAADQEWGAYHMNSHNPIVEVFKEGRVKSFANRPAFVSTYPGLEDPLLEAGIHAWAGVPMVVSGEVVGVMVVHWAQERLLSTDELKTLGSIAAQVGQSIERARLTESQADAVGVLQRVVLPGALPEFDGVELAGRHLAASAGVPVGGDWYDAFTSPAGEMVLVVGDVAGRGVETAASMGQLRNSVRAFVSEGHRPAAVLERLNAMTARENVYASVACAFLSTRGTLEWASAGHPLPLLEAHGVIRQLGADVDPALGADPAAVFASHHGALDPGETLVLFSNGVLDARGNDAALDELELELSRARSTTLDVRCSQVLEEVVGGRERDDDLCLLMVRRGEDGEERAAQVFAQGLRAPAAARAFVDSVLQGWGLVDQVDTALLLVSEAVTNSVVHARSCVKVTVRRSRHFVSVNVHDSSPVAPIRRGDSVDAVNGRGVALIDMLSDDWGVDQTTGGKDLWFTLTLP